MKYKIEVEYKVHKIEEIEAETLNEAITKSVKVFADKLVDNHGVYEFSIKEYKGEKSE